MAAGTVPASLSGLCLAPPQAEGAPFPAGVQGCSADCDGETKPARAEQPHHGELSWWCGLCLARPVTWMPRESVAQARAPLEEELWPLRSQRPRGRRASPFLVGGGLSWESPRHPQHPLPRKEFWILLGPQKWLTGRAGESLEGCREGSSGNAGARSSRGKGFITAAPKLGFLRHNGLAS